MIRPLLIGLAIVVVLGACSDQAGPLPSGTFAGSTEARRAITIEITGREVKVDQTKARLLSNGTIEARRLPGRPTLKCRSQAKGEELRCTLRRGREHETVELMRT